MVYPEHVIARGRDVLDIFAERQRCAVGLSDLHEIQIKGSTTETRAARWQRVKSDPVLLAKKRAEDRLSARRRRAKRKAMQG